MYYDDIDFYAIDKGQFHTKICNRNKKFFNFWTNKVKIHSVIHRWKNETNGQKKFSPTTYCIWKEEPIYHFDPNIYNFGSLIN